MSEVRGHYGEGTSECNWKEQVERGQVGLEG